MLDDDFLPAERTQCDHIRWAAVVFVCAALLVRTIGLVGLMFTFCKYHCHAASEDENEEDQDHGVAQRHSDIERCRKRDREKYLALGGRRKDYQDGASIWFQISQHRFQVNLMNAVHFHESGCGRCAFIFGIVWFFIENIGQSVLQGMYFLSEGESAEFNRDAKTRLSLWFEEPEFDTDPPYIMLKLGLSLLFTFIALVHYTRYILRAAHASWCGGRQAHIDFIATKIFAYHLHKHIELDDLCQSFDDRYADVVLALNAIRDHP